MDSVERSEAARTIQRESAHTRSQHAPGLAAERLQLATLYDPLKSHALKAATGSLTGIKALHTELIERVPPAEDCLRVAPVTISGLVVAAVPVQLSLEPSVQQSIQCAALSLHSLATLALAVCEDPKHALPMLAFITRHNVAIFIWLSFIQIHFFRPGPDRHSGISKGLLPDVAHTMVEQTILGFVRLLATYKDDVDFHDLEYITSTVFGLWKNFVPVYIDETNDPCLAIEGCTAVLVADSIIRDIQPRPPGNLEIFGGVSSMILLHLASVDKYIDQMTASERKRSHAYAALLQALHNTLRIFNAGFIARCTIAEVSNMVDRLSNAVLWLINDRPRAHSTYGVRSNNAYLLDDNVCAYCRFLGLCPTTPKYYALEHALQLGLAEKLRAGLPGLDYLVPNRASLLDQVIDAFGSLSRSSHSSFRLAKKAYALNACASREDQWRKFDCVIELIERFNESASNMARQLDLCSTCSKRPEEDRLRVCSGCYVYKYCSGECQRIDWARDHRTLCKLFRLSGADHRLIRTTRATGFLQIAVQEQVRRDSAFYAAMKTALSASAMAVPSNEIPILHCDLNPALAMTNIKVKCVHDFPEIFLSDNWHPELMLKITETLRKTGYPAHLIVVSLPVRPGVLEINMLSPLYTLGVVGLVPNAGLLPSRPHVVAGTR